jgi:sterol desaturase/sphingolipid hydroxylase (fatty acid hydroxylase superfamily)
VDWKFTALLFSLGLFGALEQLYPFFDFKQPYANRIATNFSLGVVNILGTRLTTTLALAWVWQQHYWSGLFSGIHSPYLAFILSALLLDGYMYSWHRLMHTTAWGWRFHQVHHTDWSMNISTAYRFHPVEVILSNVPKIILIGVFGIPPICVLIYEALYAIQLVFEHSNWELNSQVDRWLSYGIVTPNYHRHHHSKSFKDSSSNFSSFLSIWDAIGRSRAYPQEPKSINLGINKPIQNNVISLILLPFESMKRRPLS